MPGIGKLKTKGCGCEVTCDLCGLDVFSGGDQTAETIRLTVTGFSSSGACTPLGGSGAAALLGGGGTPIVHDCAWAFNDGNGCPVYINTNAGTGVGENGRVTVIVGQTITTCGTTDCAVFLTYNPSAQIQRIYEYTGGAWSSCSATQTGACTPGNSTIGTILVDPVVL